MTADGDAEPDETAPELESSALLVIDTQVDFIEPGASAVPGTRAVLPAIERLLSAYRSAGLPIVHVVRLYQGEDVELLRRRRTRDGNGPVRPGTSGSQIAPTLLPPDAPNLDPELLLTGAAQKFGPDEVALWKPRWSAFYRTALQTHLAEQRTSTVVIAGCNFPNCPRATAYDASARDLRVLVASDATSGATAGRLADLRLIGAHVAGSASIVRGLGGR